MASSNHHDSQYPQNNQSIPLQDLSRPAGTAIADEHRHSRRRSWYSSNRVRQSYGIGRHPVMSSTSRGRRYERLAEDSPNLHETYVSNTVQPASLSQGPGASPYRSGDGRATPPPNPGEFQQAISSVGLSFHVVPSRS